MECSPKYACVERCVSRATSDMRSMESVQMERVSESERGPATASAAMRGSPPQKSVHTAYSEETLDRL